jgi:hypothetical protein
MVTDRSGAPKGRVFVWRGSPRAKSTRPAGPGTPVHRQADGPHATTSSPYWAVPAAGVAPVMSWCAVRASPACRTGLRRAIGLARCAVRLKRATSPARWSGAAMRWRGSAMVATGSVSRRVCFPDEGEASGLDHPDWSGPLPSTSHPYGGRHPKQPARAQARVARGFAPPCPRQPWSRGFPFGPDGPAVRRLGLPRHGRGSVDRDGPDDPLE